MLHETQRGNKKDKLPIEAFITGIAIFKHSTDAIMLVTHCIESKKRRR
jgi:hypothetical protein